MKKVIGLLIFVFVFCEFSYAQVEGTLRRHFISSRTPVYDIRAYGAVAGSANDSAAVQTAIDSAFNHGGGTVYIPPGTFNIDGEITMKDSVALIGATGPLASIFDFSGNGGDKQGIKTAGADNWYIGYLTLQGIYADSATRTDERAAIDVNNTFSSGAWQTDKGSWHWTIDHVIFDDVMIAVRMGGAKYGLITNCEVKGGTTSGAQGNAFRFVPHVSAIPDSGSRNTEYITVTNTKIHATNFTAAFRFTGSTGTAAVAHRYITISECEIDTSDGPFVSVAEAMNHTKFINNTFTNSGSTADGIAFNDGSKAVDKIWDQITISGNTIRGVQSGQVAIYIIHSRAGTTADRFMINNNNIDGDDVTLVGIWINNTSGTFSVDHQIDGNRLFEMVNSGIYVKKIRGGNINNNNSQLNTWDGILVVDSDGNTFDGNTCNQNARDGFRIQNSDYNVFASNQAQFNGSGGAGNQNGFFIISDSDKNVFDGNIANDVAGSPNQLYGIRINSIDCGLNLVTNNNLWPNVTAALADGGTATHTYNNILSNDWPSIFNVKNFGAIGDSTTIEYTAILQAQAQLDAASGKKGILYFPAGKYSLGPNQIRIRSNTTVRGDGIGNTIIYGDSANNVFYTAGGDSNIVIEHLTIDGNSEDSLGYTQNDHGVSISGSKRVTIQNVHIRNTGGDGIYILDTDDVKILNNIIEVKSIYKAGSVGRNGIAIVEGEGIIISGNAVSGGWPTCINLTPTVGLVVENVEIINNVVTPSDSFTYGIQLVSTANRTIQDVLIEGNIVDGTGLGLDYTDNGYGIRVEFAKRTIINDNTIKDWGSNGLQIEEGTYDIQISNNNVYSNNLEGIFLGTGQINLAHIEGNKIHENGQRGIYLNSTSGNEGKNIFVEGNFIYDNSQRTDDTYDGILVQWVDRLAIHDNMIFNTGTTGHQYGLQIQSSDTVTVRNNTLFGGVSGDFKHQISSRNIIYDGNSIGKNEGVVNVNEYSTFADALGHAASFHPPKPMIMRGTYDINDGAISTNAVDSLLIIGENARIISSRADTTDGFIVIDSDYLRILGTFYMDGGTQGGRNFEEALRIMRSNYFYIEGFRIKNSITGVFADTSKYFTLNNIIVDSCNAGIYVEGNNSSQFGTIQNSQVWNIAGGSKIVYGPATVGGINNMVEGKKEGHIFVAKDSLAALQIQSIGGSFWNYVYADSASDVVAFGAEGITLPALTEYGVIVTTAGNVGIKGVVAPEHALEVAGAIAVEDLASLPDSVANKGVFASVNGLPIFMDETGNPDTLNTGDRDYLYAGSTRLSGGSYLADSTFATDEVPSGQLDITITPTLLVGCTASGTVTFIPEARDTPGAAGSDIIGNSLIATTSCDSVEVFIGGDIAAGKYVVADVSAVSNATGFLWTLRFESTNNIVSSHDHDQIVDADNDTKIQVEESPDEDIIRFDVAGTEVMRINASGGVEVYGYDTGNFIADEYDLRVGSTANDSAAVMRIGNLELGTSDDRTVGPGLTAGGTVFLGVQNVPDGIGEFIFTTAGGNIRIAIPRSGVGYGTYNARSGMYAGPSVMKDSIMIGSYWGFNRLAMDTGANGADLGVQNNVQIGDSLYVNTAILIGGKQFTTQGDSTLIKPDLIYTSGSLDVAGGLFFSLVTKTTTYTATINDHTIICDGTSGTFTITLPTAASSFNNSDDTGLILEIKKIDSSANAITVDGSGAETIDGSATAVIQIQYNSITIQSDGTEWWIL